MERNGLVLETHKFKQDTCHGSSKMTKRIHSKTSSKAGDSKSGLVIKSTIAVSKGHTTKLVIVHIVGCQRIVQNLLASKD
jgi:hypothetical protein